MFVPLLCASGRSVTTQCVTHVPDGQASLCVTGLHDLQETLQSALVEPSLYVTTHSQSCFSSVCFLWPSRHDSRGQSSATAYLSSRALARRVSQCVWHCVHVCVCTIPVCTCEAAGLHDSLPPPLHLVLHLGLDPVSGHNGTHAASLPPPAVATTHLHHAVICTHRSNSSVTAGVLMARDPPLLCVLACFRSRESGVWSCGLADSVSEPILDWKR